MAISIQAQGWAMVQAVLLGAAAGGVYDLFRVLRVRLPVRFLGSVLDLLFWLCVTGALFLWSLDAWGGWIRLYGAAGLMTGGVVYFRLLSARMLKLGYWAADLVTIVCRLVFLPITGLIFLMKKIKNFVKNRFPYGGKWYKINQITEETVKVNRPRAARGCGGACDASQKSRVSDQGGRAGSAGLHGDLSAESARPAAQQSGGTGDPVRPGG